MGFTGDGMNDHHTDRATPVHLAGPSGAMMEKAAADYRGWVRGLFFPGRPGAILKEGAGITPGGCGCPRCWWDSLG